MTCGGSLSIIQKHLVQSVDDLLLAVDASELFLFHPIGVVDGRIEALEVLSEGDLEAVHSVPIFMTWNQQGSRSRRPTCGRTCFESHSQ